MLICERCAKFCNGCECVPYDVECDENFKEKVGTETTMKEMVYTPNTIKEVLYEGTYLDHKFVILNLGMHPTAYVECKVDNCQGYMDSRLDDVQVHCGFTYFGQPHWTDEDKTVYLGWDYGHSGDFAGYYIEHPEWEILGEKKWTTEEIYHEVQIVIKDLIKVENLSNIGNSLFDN